jgi:Skp family chaperone for outer membrane proteins
MTAPGGLRAALLALGLSLASVPGLVVSTPVAAQEPLALPPPIIAVLDVQTALRQSTAALMLQQEIDAQRNAYQAELRSREVELREKNKELVKQRSTLTAEAFAQSRKDLEQEMALFQREMVGRKRSLERMFAQGMREIELQLLHVADELATERGANLVLPKSAVILVHSDFEITAEAVARLNEVMPNIETSAE